MDIDGLFEDIHGYYWTIRGCPNHDIFPTQAIPKIQELHLDPGHQQHCLRRPAPPYGWSKHHGKNHQNIANIDGWLRKEL